MFIFVEAIYDEDGLRVDVKSHWRRNQVLKYMGERIGEVLTTAFWSEDDARRFSAWTNEPIDVVFSGDKDSFSCRYPFTVPTDIVPPQADIAHIHMRIFDVDDRFNPNQAAVIMARGDNGGIIMEMDLYDDFKAAEAALRDSFFGCWEWAFNSFV